MAHIFKHPNRQSKGIIVFTHKEFNYFCKGVKISKSDLFSFWKLIIKIYKLKDPLILKKYIKEINKNYFIGVHWGWHFENVKSPEWVDFHMSDDVATFVNNPFIIPLSSGNFTPSVMKNKKTEKYWDIITVAKSKKTKNYNHFLKSIRKIYDLGHNYKVLAIIASNKVEDNSGYYTSILKDYFQMFSAKERELFTLIKTDQNYGFQGFSSAFLSHLYNQSKIFTIFSQTEGTCKVIKEAQMCGLPVVLKKDLKGGVLSFLSEHKDAMFFDKYENAHEILIKSIQNYNNFQVDFEKNKKRIGENESLHMLKKYFYKLYEKNNQFFDEQLINTDNLNRRLPAHFFDDSVKWALSDEYRFKTTDITNFMMFKKFYNELKLSSKNEI